MAIDRFDGVALAGVLGLTAATAVFNGTLVAAVLGGFLLSLSVWRLYDGRPWEALGWAAWVGTAVTLVVDGGTAVAVAIVGFTVAGFGFLFGSRFGLLPDVWTVDESPDVGT